MKSQKCERLEISGSTTQYTRQEVKTLRGFRAGVAELVDAPALGAGEATCVGSSPSARIFFRANGLLTL